MVTSTRNPRACVLGTATAPGNITHNESHATRADLKATDPQCSQQRDAATHAGAVRDA